MSKFEKNLLNKLLAFFIVMSDHTLVFVVQPPNGQKSYTSTLVLLLAPYTYERFFNGKFLIFCWQTLNFEIHEKKSIKNSGAHQQSLKKQQNKHKITKFLL